MRAFGRLYLTVANLFFGKAEMEDGKTLADYNPWPTAWTRAPSCASRSPRRWVLPACLPPPPPPPPRAGPACALLGLADLGGGAAGRRDGLEDPGGGGGAVGSKPEERDPWRPRRVHWWWRRGALGVERGAFLFPMFTGSILEP